MQDVLSSVIQGVTRTGGLLEAAAVSTATRFERQEQLEAAEQQAAAEHDETETSSSLPATGFTTAELQEMRQNSSLGLEFEQARQTQAVAEYAANANLLQAWQEATGRSFDRKI